MPGAGKRRIPAARDRRQFKPNSKLRRRGSRVERSAAALLCRSVFFTFHSVRLQQQSPRGLVNLEAVLAMPRLEVTIGPDRFHTEVAWVNCTSRPTEIDTPNFTGRVLVLVRDFAGVTPDDSPPKRNAAYFEGRTRRFGILIEGKWKHQPGVQPYTGDEIQFGSDFDYLPDSFPMG